MKAMLLPHLANLKTDVSPLVLSEIPIPIPGPQEVLIKVSACGVCHTELDEIEGRMPPAKFPVVLGHQVVGKVVEKGAQVISTATGTRVGVAWIFLCVWRMPVLPIGSGKPLRGFYRHRTGCRRWLR